MNQNRFYYTYKITLLLGDCSGKYYYGQHTTNNLKDNYAGSGRILQRYYEKYRAIEGVTYTKEILKFYNSPEELNRAENILIGDLWKTDPNCLNLCPGGNVFSGEGNPFYGRHHSEKTKAILRKKNKGRMPTNLEDLKKYGYEKSAPVDQYDKYGNFIKSWDHLVDAAKILNIDSGSIGSVAKGQRVRAGGFVWRYKNNPFNKYRTENKKLTTEQLSALGRAHSACKKPVIQISKDGKIIGKYESCKDAERQTDIISSSIGAVCLGKRRSAGGYYWKYI